jgi:hypothetical protein
MDILHQKWVLMIVTVLMVQFRHAIETTVLHFMTGFCSLHLKNVCHSVVLLLGDACHGLQTCCSLRIEVLLGCVSYVS